MNFIISAGSTLAIDAIVAVGKANVKGENRIELCLKHLPKSAC